MSISSDISSLFKHFGGRPDQYQEITQADCAQESIERWPSIAKSEGASLSVGNGAAAALFPSQSSPPLAAVMAVKDVAVSVAPAVTTVEVVKASPLPARAGKSLQSLLAKLAQDERKSVAEESVAVPQLSRVKVVAVVSAKGGVGKSTMAANLAAAMHKKGHPVLAVDLDPQNALHHHFEALPGQERDALNAGVVHSAEDWRAIGIPSSTGVFVLPYGDGGEGQRRAFEKQLEGEPQWLAHKLSELQLADDAVVVIDTPPGPSIYLQQALSVANVALVVSLSDAGSYNALPMIEGLITTYTAARESFIGAAYLINQVDPSRQLSKDITRIMMGQLGKQVIGVVHRDQAITEALAYNRNVLEYAPNGAGCLDMLTCADVLLNMLAAGAKAEQSA